MKIKIFVALILMMAVFAPIAGQAQGLNGENEFAVTGAWFDLSGGGTSIKLTAIGGSYGKFLSPNWEVSAPLLYANASAEGDNLNIYALEPQVTYHFVSDSPAVPYLGTGATWVDINGNKGIGSHTSTKLTYYAGVKFFLGKTPATSDKAIFLEYRHLDFNFSGTSGNNPDVRADGLWAGMTFYTK